MSSSEAWSDVPLAPPDPDRRGELRGLWRGLRRAPRVLARGAVSAIPVAGPPVLVLPGLLTGDGSTLVMRRHLRSLGHDARAARIGFNDGRLERLLPRAEARLAALSRRAGGPVQLVGWSLGGVIARELARRAPGQVARIVTLGTPVRGGPRYTSARWIYERRGLDLDLIEDRVRARNAAPIAAPITAIYSRRDAVVAWQACLDPNPHNDVTYVEVGAYHCELGFCPEALGALARHLEGPGELNRPGGRRVGRRPWR